MQESGSTLTQMIVQAYALGGVSIASFLLLWGTWMGRVWPPVLAMVLTMPLTAVVTLLVMFAGANATWVLVPFTLLGLPVISLIMAGSRLRGLAVATALTWVLAWCGIALYIVALRAAIGTA